MLLTATYAAVFVRHKHPRAWFAAMRRVSRPIQSSQSAVDGCNEVRRYGGQEQKQPGDGPDSGPIRMCFHRERSRMTEPASPRAGLRVCPECLTGKWSGLLTPDCPRAWKQAALVGSFTERLRTEATLSLPSSSADYRASHTETVSPRSSPYEH